MDSAARRAWGVPVVLSTAVPAKTALMLDRNALTVDTDRLGIDVTWSDAVSDDFAKNQFRARVEGRYSYSLFQPKGVVKATLAL